MLIATERGQYNEENIFFCPFHLLIGVSKVYKIKKSKTFPCFFKIMVIFANHK